MKRSAFALFAYSSVGLIAIGFLLPGYCRAADSGPIYKYGYAIFRDAGGDFIQSDGKGAYIDLDSFDDFSNFDFGY